MFKSKINYTLSIPITFFFSSVGFKTCTRPFFFQPIDRSSKTAIDRLCQYLSPELTNKLFYCHYRTDSRRRRS